MRILKILLNVEKYAWIAFTDAIKTISGNYMDPNYKEIEIRKFSFFLDPYTRSSRDKYISWMLIWATFPKIWELWVKTKVKGATRIQRRWREGTKVNGVSTWWSTTIGCCTEGEHKKKHIHGRLTSTVLKRKDRFNRKGIWNLVVNFIL